MFYFPTHLKPVRFIGRIGRVDLSCYMTRGSQDGVCLFDITLQSHGNVMVTFLRKANTSV